MVYYWNIQFLHIFNYPMIYQICDILMTMRQGAFLNISFKPQLINPQHLVLTDISQGNVFWNLLNNLQDWGPGPDPDPFNLAACPNYSITSYAKFLVFHFFERANKEELKRSLKIRNLVIRNQKYQLLKIVRSCYIVISLKS